MVESPEIKLSLAWVDASLSFVASMNPIRRLLSTGCWMVYRGDSVPGCIAGGDLQGAGQGLIRGNDRLWCVSGVRRQLI